MATPLIPQEIYLLERYSSAEYFEKLRDAFAEMLKAAEEALAEVMTRLPADYRKRPTWEQPDRTWGEVVLPNLRWTMEGLNTAFIQLTHGEFSALESAGNVNTAFASIGRDFSVEWMPEPYLTRYDNAEMAARERARNIATTAQTGWNTGALSTRYNPPARGPLDAPPSWPQYRLNPKVRVATDATVEVNGVYLPDADESAPQFMYAGPDAPPAWIGFDRATMQNIGEANTIWTLVEHINTSGGGIPGADNPEVAGFRLRCEAGQPCPQAGFWFTPAQIGSRREFKAGEVMPEMGGDYGVTIWQWDQNQELSKL